MIPDHVRESIEHMIEDCAQTDYEDFQQIDLGCVEQWLKAEREPITQDALKAAGWKYMLWNHVTDEWSKNFGQPPYEHMHANLISVRFKEWKNKPPDEPTVYLYLPNTIVKVPGCTTIYQLEKLFHMMKG